MREIFLKEEICHVKMISFTSAWLNISKKTRKNEGNFFKRRNMSCKDDQFYICLVEFFKGNKEKRGGIFSKEGIYMSYKDDQFVVIHKTQNGHLRTKQDMTVFIRARQLNLSIDGQVQIQ